MSEADASTRAGQAPVGGGGTALFALALVAVVFVLTLLAYRPPAPRGADAPAAEFSAGRAMEVVASVVGDGSPRPVGSEANARARRWIVGRLRELGYEPQVQTVLACSSPRWGNCAEVHNVLARRDGRDGGPAVLLAAHYDSVPAGPGAADDASGVGAVLEVARALAEEPPAENPVIFLLLDAEEAGLVGARAFVDEHPWASEAGVVVNVEARGSSGPSLMFETTPETAWLSAQFAAAVERPVTSSFFYEIYRRLPNDTDFTVLRNAGIKGYNFAFIEGVEHYHRPSDDLERLSAASLQHQGASLLALARRLAAADLGAARPGGAVYFDLLGRTLVRWPQGWTLPLAVLALVLWLVAVVLLLKRRVLRGAALAWGLGGWVLMVAGAGAALFVLDLLLKGLGALPPPWLFPWIARPTPAVAAFWASAVAAATAVTLLLARRAGPWGAWAGVWFFWTFAALAVALALPGASYLFLVPALAAAVLGVAAAARGGTGALAATALVAPPAVAALLWLFLALVLYHGLGTPGLLAGGLVVAILATSLAPPLAAWEGRARWALPALALVAAIAGVVLAAAAPAFTADHRRPVNLAYYQDGFSGLSRWLIVGRSPRVVPEAWRETAEFGDEPIAAYPWSRTPWHFVAPAPAVDLPPPRLTFVEEVAAGDGARRLRGRLVSPRGAPIVRFHLTGEPRVDAVILEGREIWTRPESGDGEGSVRYLTLPPEGAEVEVVTLGTERDEIWIADESYGLPPAGGALVAERPESVAPSTNGDVTVVSRAVALAVSAEAGDGEAAAEEEEEPAAREAA